MTLRELGQFIQELPEDKQDYAVIFWDGETGKELELGEIRLLDYNVAELIPIMPITNGD